MSTISEHQPLVTRAKAERLRIRALYVHPRPRRTAERSGTVSVMGPANRAPGVPIMGAADAGSHDYVMGGPDR